MTRRGVSLVILLLAGLVSFQPAWASDGCPDGWTPVGDWYPEDGTCKRRCSMPGQDDWWMDSGGQARPGCEAPLAPAPTYYDVWGDRQAPKGDCPPGYEPEHVWFEQDGVCMLDCVNKDYADVLIGIEFDRCGWLNTPRHMMQVYVVSEESRPPWCILEEPTRRKER